MDKDMYNQGDGQQNQRTEKDIYKTMEENLQHLHEYVQKWLDKINDENYTMDMNNKED